MTNDSDFLLEDVCGVVSVGSFLRLTEYEESFCDVVYRRSRLLRELGLKSAETTRDFIEHLPRWLGDDYHKLSQRQQSQAMSMTLRDVLREHRSVREPFVSSVSVTKIDWKTVVSNLRNAVMTHNKNAVLPIEDAKVKQILTRLVNKSYMTSSMINLLSSDMSKQLARPTYLYVLISSESRPHDASLKLRRLRYGLLFPMAAEPKSSSSSSSSFHEIMNIPEWQGSDGDFVRHKVTPIYLFSRELKEDKELSRVVSVLSETSHKDFHVRVLIEMLTHLLTNFKMSEREVLALLGSMFLPSHDEDKISKMRMQWYFPSRAFNIQSQWISIVIAMEDLAETICLVLSNSPVTMIKSPQLFDLSKFANLISWPECYALCVSFDEKDIDWVRKLHVRSEVCIGDVLSQVSHLCVKMKRHVFRKTTIKMSGVWGKKKKKKSQDARVGSNMFSALSLDDDE